jgi:hypothetical protein
MASIRPIIQKFLAIPLLPGHTALSDLGMAPGKCRPAAAIDRGLASPEATDFRSVIVPRPRTKPARA